MPSTVRYKLGYPSASKPVAQSASLSSNGIAAGSATFITGAGAQPFVSNQEVSPGMFPAFSSLRVSKLFVESVSYFKKDGLNYCEIELIGALSQPVITKTSRFALRNFSKTVTFTNGAEAERSFDYYSETINWSWVFPRGVVSDIATPTTARFGASFNQIGKSTLVQRQSSGIFGVESLSLDRLVPANPTFITTTSEETRGNMVYFTKSVEAIYQ
jgi:hypothetical protein